MISKNFYLNILLRVCLMAMTALVIGWLVFEKGYIFTVIPVALVFVLQLAELVYYFNRTNRKIAIFLESMRNEDSSLEFSEFGNNKTIRELNTRLKSLNELFRKTIFDLEEQERYFKTILENVSIGIITIKKDGSILLSNTAARNLLEYEHLSNLKQLARIDNKLHTSFESLKPGDRKMVSFKGKSGVKQLSLKSTSLRTMQDSYQLVAVQDIKNEIESKELESWIKLIRVLMHEIMNTIAPMTSLSQSLLDYYEDFDGEPPPEDVIRNTIKGLKVINERGTGLTSFVETYRQLTRIPPPEKKAVKLVPLLDNIIMLVNIDGMDENIDISRQVKPDDLEIIADKKQISQVLINLIKNSQEALKESVRGIIKLQAGVNKNGRVQIAVIDNGIGVDEEMMEKIFVPFFTTKESGSGIGLSLSRQIMLIHGGSLKLISEPGKITKAILEF